MMKAFEDLGALTSANWEKLGGQQQAFPEAATAALGDSGVLDRVQVGEVVDWLAGSQNIPQQDAKDFGQPPIIVYSCKDFCIQLLIWLDATTAVHEHSFAGAFGVLSGSSVHSRYNFELRNELSNEFRLGDVRFVSSELLQRGDVRTIRIGDSFIHSLFHLERPSVSVVVRTHGRDLIQYSYIKPYVAFNPFHYDKTLEIQLRLLDSLRILRSDGFWKYVNRLVENNRPLLVFNALGNAHQFSETEPARWQELADKAERLHGSELIRCMVASIAEDEKTKRLTRLRAVVHDPDYRFFLALLLNVPERDTLLSLVAQRFNSKQPETLVMKWIREMSGTGLFPTRFEPEVLDAVELLLQHKSFNEAWSALLARKAAPAAISEEKMRKLWNDAESIFFRAAV